MPNNLVKGLKATRNQDGNAVKGDGRNAFNKAKRQRLLIDKWMDWLKAKQEEQGKTLEDTKKEMEDKIKEANALIDKTKKFFSERLKEIGEDSARKQETIEEVMKRLESVDKEIFGLGGQIDSLNGNVRINLGDIDKIAKDSDPKTNITEQVHAVLIEDKEVGGVVDIHVSWNKDNVTKYKCGEVWYLIEPDDMSEVKTAKWEKVSSKEGERKAIIPNVKRGKMYLIRIIAVNQHGEKSIQKDAPTFRHQVSAMDMTPPQPNLFELSWNQGVPLWEWRQPDNISYMWSELRIDENPGEDKGLLDRTLSCKSNAIPPQRTATVYLYNKGPGSYAKPLQKSYLKAVPSAPKHVKAEAVFEGVKVTYDAVPEDCSGVIVFVNGERYETAENPFLYHCAFGTYTIEVAFYDIYGDGIHSAPITVEQRKKIEHTKIADNAIESPQIAANAIVAGKIAADAVGTNQIQANAIKSQHIEAKSLNADRIQSHTITAEQIAPKAIKTEYIDAKAITAEQIAPNAVTADKIKAGVITAGKIASKAVEAENINVNSLSALSAKIGLLRTSDSGARMEIRDNLIKVYDSYGRLRVKMGVW